jgi:hypothetical protein
MKYSTKKTLVIIGIVIFIILAVVLSQFFLNIWWYQGKERDSYGSVEVWWSQRQFEESTTFTIFDYTFVQTKYDRYAVGRCTARAKANSGTSCSVKEPPYPTDQYTWMCSVLSTSTDSFGCVVDKTSCSGYSDVWYCGCTSGGCGNCYCKLRYDNSIGYSGNYTISVTDANGYVLYGCSQRTLIYKNGVLMDSVGELPSSGSTTASTSFRAVREYPEFILELMVSSQYDSNSRSCYSILNDVIMKYYPENTTFKTSFDYPDSDKVSFNVNLTNSLSYPVIGVLNTKVCSDSFCKEYNTSFDVSVGFNQILIDTDFDRISQVTITNSLEVYVSYELLNLGSSNLACVPGSGAQYGISWCKANGYDKLKLGKAAVEIVTYEPSFVECGGSV